MNRTGHLAALVFIQITLAAVMVWAAFEGARWPFLVIAGFASAACTAYAYWKGAPGMAAVLATAIVLRLLWLGVPPSLSDDSYRYAWDGMLVADGQNPYEYVPSDPALEAYRSHPVYAKLNSPDYYSVYPPASQAVFGVADWISGSSHPASFFVYKSLLVFLELLALFVLARMAPAGIVMLFSWNPVVILAGAGQAHSDVLLALPIVLAVFLARKRRWGGTGAFVALASLVKIWPLLAAPLLIRRRRAMVAGVVVGVLSAAPFMASYVIPNVRESLELYVSYFEFNAGLYYAIKRGLLIATSEDWSKQLGPAMRQGYLVVVPLVWILAWRRRWPLESLLFALISLHLLSSTTVHPWYFYPVLLLAALRGRKALAWHWVAVSSLGTYLLYAGGPYWPFVWAGWGGFLVLGAWEYWPRLIEVLLKGRARWKADWIFECVQSDVPEMTTCADGLLDIGGAEGYVAARLGTLLERPATVAEVRNAKRADVDYCEYDGSTLPFASGRFGAAVAVFTLHHATDAGRVLSEMARVTQGPLVVVESVYRKRAGHIVLRQLDLFANRLRSWGRKGLEAKELHFRTANQWRSLFKKLGLTVTHEEARYNLLHKKHLFRLEARAVGETIEPVE